VTFKVIDMLSDIQGAEALQAEGLYKEALGIDAQHLDCLWSYASFLSVLPLPFPPPVCV